MALNISPSSVEHSLLRPDDGQVVEVREIDVVSLKDYADRSGITEFDFVKIEAEGVELEVFDGLDDLRPRKLAIDVSPERDGVSPADEFRERLTHLGYEIRQRGHVMFAKLKSKTIYSLWLQGRDAAPDLVRLNFERWTALNPDYQLKVLDRRDVDELFEGVDLPIWDLPIQALSDVVRARLLRDNGGVWVDATVFPVEPLSQWLDDAFTEAGFFAFERPGPDRMISSWFLAATPRHLILREWWRQIERFWSKPRRLMEKTPADPVASVSPAGSTDSDQFPYFWFHYLFQYLVESHTEFAEAWSRCTKMGAGPPHRLQELFANAPNPSSAEIRSAANAAPMQKLTWRVSYPLDVLACVDVPPGRRNVNPRKHPTDLLLAEVGRDPEDTRSVYFLAQSYFDLKDFTNARKWYARRAEMGRGDEEVYYSMFRVAQSMAHLDTPWMEVQDAYLRAWEFRPTRAEALHGLAVQYRKNKRYQLGYLFAERAAQIPLPEHDHAMVNSDIYIWRATEEQAICAWWIGKHDEAFTLCRRLLARPDIPDDARQEIARNRDFSVPSMIEAASSYPKAVVDNLVAGPPDAEVTVTLSAGPDRAATEKTLNSFLHCCTDISRAGRFLLLANGLSAHDRATLQQRYGFLEFAVADPSAHITHIRKHIHGRYWLHLSHNWQFFAPENLITRLTTVLDTEPHIFQVAINHCDATTLTGTSAAEHTVRRTPDTSRYVLTSEIASGPAMFDTTRLDQADGTAATINTATLDEILCTTTETPPSDQS
jgi:tetratricopeptide (TPR) repeat protein